MGKLKKFFLLIYVKKELLLILLGVFLFYIDRVPIRSYAGDSLLAWPITDKLLHPNYYSPNDLIVNAGVSGNFLFYKALSLITFFHENLPLRDFLFYTPIFFLFVVAWSKLFFEISHDKKITAVALLLFFFSDQKLGLNWSVTPCSILVSYTSVHFLQVFAFFFFLRKKYILSFFLLGLTSYFHPSTSLVYFLVLSVILIINFLKEKRLYIMTPVFLYIILFAPNVFYLASIFQGIGGRVKEFFYIFYNFQYHAYLEDHFKDGYAYTISLMALLFILFRQAKINITHRREIFLIFLVSMIGSVIWLMNLYFLHYMPFIYTYFITKIFYILKPLIIILLTMAMVDLSKKSKQLVDILVYAFLTMTTYTFSPLLSLIILVSFYAYLIKKSLALPVIMIPLALSIILNLEMFKPVEDTIKNFTKDNNVLVFELGMLLIIMPTLAYILNKHLKTQRKLSFTISRNAAIFYVLSTLFLLLLIIKNNIRGSRDYGYVRISGDYAQLLNWAKRSEGKLFIVPPQNNLFPTFRYFTKNSTYAHISDINQLMYSPGYYYFEGFNRLKKIGLIIERRREYNFDKYYKLTAKEIKDTNADYIIFEKKGAFDERRFSSGKVYENISYIVYDVKDL